MKKLLLFTLLISGFCHGQCTEMIVSNDDVSETTSIKSEKLIVKDLSMTVWCVPYNKSLYYFDFIVKDKCIDSESEIIVCFKNGDKVKYYNTSYNFNCAGQSAMKISSKNRKVFTNEKITIIRVGTTNGNYYQVELSEEESDALLRIFQCAFNRESWEKEIKYKKG